MYRLTKITTTIYVLFTAMFLLSSSIQADEDIDWILTGSNPSLDRGTKFLSNGFTESGIRYATKVLKNKDLGALEAVIAYQNLCIAYNKKGDDQTAEKYCEYARNATKPKIALKKIKDGLYKVSRKNNKYTFGDIVSGNLSLQRNSRQIAQSLESIHQGTN